MSLLPPWILDPTHLESFSDRASQAIKYGVLVPMGRPCPRHDSRDESCAPVTSCALFSIAFDRSKTASAPDGEFGVAETKDGGDPTTKRSAVSVQNDANSTSWTPKRRNRSPKVTGEKLCGGEESMTSFFFSLAQGVGLIDCSFKGAVSKSGDSLNLRQLWAWSSQPGKRDPSSDPLERSGRTVRDRPERQKTEKKSISHSLFPYIANGLPYPRMGGLSPSDVIPISEPGADAFGGDASPGDLLNSWESGGLAEANLARGTVPGDVTATSQERAKSRRGGGARGRRADGCEECPGRRGGSAGFVFGVRTEPNPEAVLAESRVQGQQPRGRTPSFGDQGAPPSISGGTARRSSGHRSESDRFWELLDFLYSSCIIRWLSRRFGKNDALRKSEESSRSLSNSFTEHHLDVVQLSRIYSASNIDTQNPKLSKGMSKEEAERRLQKDGPNALAPPAEISNLTLFLRQFLNMFWILLMGAAILSLSTFIIDPSQWTRVRVRPGAFLFLLHPFVAKRLFISLLNHLEALLTSPFRVIINLYAAIVLFVIVIAMCIITFYQEKKALNVVRGFTNLLPTKCTVVREGRSLTIETEKIVVGDVVLVKSGSRVPADIRMLHTSDLKLEASSITGEAEPLDFTEEPVAVHVDVFEANNVAFNGSFCIDGEGVGVAIRTGQRTIIGQIAALTTEQAGSGESSLEYEINRFVKFVTVSAITMAFVVFLLGCIMTRFQDVTGMFINGFLVIIIANVPQGLPATVSSQLTIIARRMAKKNVYMKKLDVVEAFGAATVIASDKTGTLTMNNMTVTDLWLNGRYVSGVPEVRQKTMHTLRSVAAQNTVRSRLLASDLDVFERPLPALLTAMAVCNKATIDFGAATVTNGAEQLSVATRLRRIEDLLWKPTGRVAPLDGGDPEGGLSRPALAKRQVSTKEKQFSGSPSEVALLRYVDKVCSVPHLRQKYRIVYEVPFNSLRKWHLMVLQEEGVKSEEDGETPFLLMIKGAPEVVIQKCATLATDDGEAELDEETLMDFQDAYDHFGGNGRRVIGFAHRTFLAPRDTKFSLEEGNVPLEALSFLGIAAIMDPPRPDTARAIAQCKQAGIKVFMVTGDHPTTATAIAREIGLIGEAEKVVPQRLGKSVKVNVVEEAAEERDWATVHGKMLPDMSARDWDELLLHNYIVFARTTPEQKLLIVEQCQQRGEVVAVTGDGVNDAPALKRANIGVAMGITGSDVAKQAADIILMDDNFASIVKGIEEGRLLFDNLRKTIAYTLTHSMPEVVPICLNFLFGLPMAITALQILSIDLGTEIAPAVSLAYENAERDIMTKPPRKRSTRLVSFSLLFYSYVIAGGFVITGATLAYLFVYWWNGISLLDLFFSAQDYFRYHAAGNFTSNGLSFTEAEQIDIRDQAASSYYLTLVMSQAYHVWMCMTRRTSIFKHGINNIVTVFAVVIEVLLVIIFIYVPGIRFVMGSSPPPYQVWFFSLGVGLAMWLFNELRKYGIRKAPRNNLVRFIKW
uniref:Cation_ATPase_N domain-containing protein n=1 Tax=Steinernema glaseri TaxID=37863 RepID=A0A1I8AS76_9BILA